MSTHSSPIAAPLHRRQLSQRYQAKQSGSGRMWAVFAGIVAVIGGVIVTLIMM